MFFVLALYVGEKSESLSLGKMELELKFEKVIVLWFRQLQMPSNEKMSRDL